jgi:hypothetical protein
MDASLSSVALLPFERMAAMTWLRLAFVKTSDTTQGRQKRVQRGKAPLVVAIFGRIENPRAERVVGPLPFATPRWARQAKWRMRVRQATAVGVHRENAECSGMFV